VAFHAVTGSGYRWVADKIIEIDGFNPQIAARMPLAEARQAHEHIEAARPKGKIVLLPGKPENLHQ
jgi:hypothetical protein